MWIKYLFPPCLVAIYLFHPFLLQKYLFPKNSSPPPYSNGGPLTRCSSLRSSGGMEALMRQTYTDPPLSFVSGLYTLAPAGGLCVKGISKSNQLPPHIKRLTSLRLAVCPPPRHLVGRLASFGPSYIQAGPYCHSIVCLQPLKFTNPLS